MSELKNLKYETTAREYEDEFDSLLSRVEINEDHVVSLFMRGLPTEIEIGVRMFKPKTLADAYCLTNLQEATLNAVKKKGMSAFAPNSSTYNNSPINTFHKPLLTTSTTNVNVKLNTPVAVQNRRNTCPLSVTVADGNKLVTTSECIQWLATLGDIRFNFHELRMDFKYNNKRVLLRGTHKSNLEWLSTKVSNKVVKQAKLHSMDMCVFPYFASTCIQIEATTTDVPPVLQQMIEEYEDVFAIPKELPPKREHDHTIPLIEGAQPVNIRPYRQPPTQKDAIKEMSNSKRSCFTLKAVLEIMRHHKLFAKRSKYVFGTDKVEYLGRVISAKGVATDPSKVEVMSQWTIPTNLKQLRGFLGLTGLLVNCLAWFPSLTTKIYKKIQATWDTDEKLQKIIAKLEQGQFVKGSFSWSNKELRRKGKLVVGNDQLLRTNILKQFHEVLIGRHSGVRTTTNKIYSVFYWKKLRKHVKLMVLEYDICQSLPKSQGKTIILVVVDRLSKYAHFIPLAHPYTAIDVAQMKWLSLAEWWYNTNHHSAINTTPYEIVYGQCSPIHVPYVGGDSKLKKCKEVVTHSGSLPAVDTQGVMRVEPLAGNEE
nr:reverse transcriptase [Tanacetum cinerariifolium]